MGDSFIDNNECQRRGLCLVVVLVDGCSELRNLLFETDVSLRISETISVDDEVSGVLAIVIACKAFNGILEGLLHLSMHDLLTLLLDDELRVVLAHLFVV